MPSPQRLTALDASFLAAESERTPMHVGSVSTFEAAPFLDSEGAFRLEELRSLVNERLNLVPRFRQRVMEVPFGMGRPVWVDDPSFDVANHVKLVHLDPPGGDVELRRLCEQLHMRLLDRSRPLWELWCVDGLGHDRIAMIEKVHHSMVDGVSSVDVATALMDATPDINHCGEPDPEHEHEAQTRPSTWSLMTSALVDGARMGGAAAGSIVGSVAHPRRTALAVGQLRRPLGTLLTWPIVAPHSSLNQPIGTTRRYDIVRTSLAEAKELRAALGGTVNDVVLAAVTGGLRQFLLGRGEVVDGQSLQALVPVSLRAAGDGTPGNRVAAILATLPIGESDAEARLRAVQATMRSRKESGQATATAALMTVTDYLPPAVSAAVSRGIHRQPFVNIVVTNVPGPQVPLYMMGARMIETFPIVPLGGNLDISIGILSYDGQLNFGLYGDAETAGDLSTLAEGIEKSFVELRHLADATVERTEQ